MRPSKKTLNLSGFLRSSQVASGVLMGMGFMEMVSFAFGVCSGGKSN
jgi:hypothetical protein